MKLLSVVFLVGLSGTALAQQEAVEVGKAMAEQLKPYRECLKAEVAKAASKEQAQLIVQEACADLRLGIRSKLIATVHQILNPVPPSFNPDAAADGALKMTQVGAYYDYTGEVRAFHQRLKNQADERKQTRP
ncbi:hypothetical protein [Bradyrhizobium retamae]|uniref:Uncharacterized protein n=1 Tax=Bradyrhizobium retamae TaxID=1300035 RepID=A0A0R3ME85_9BRAD|nr:hypothetical protein [Bradyrhizobium retamae]KRR18321.1 hypothetical protein CQ13_35065 [Bradyrhizobium retamae]